MCTHRINPNDAHLTTNCSKPPPSGITKDVTTAVVQDVDYLKSPAILQCFYLAMYLPVRMLGHDFLSHVAVPNRGQLPRAPVPPTSKKWNQGVKTTTRGQENRSKDGICHVAKYIFSCLLGRRLREGNLHRMEALVTGFAIHPLTIITIWSLNPKIPI